MFRFTQEYNGFRNIKKITSDLNHDSNSNYTPSNPIFSYTNTFHDGIIKHHLHLYPQSLSTTASSNKNHKHEFNNDSRAPIQHGAIINSNNMSKDSSVASLWLITISG
jgi:hypothetical protein